MTWLIVPEMGEEGAVVPISRAYGLFSGWGEPGWYCSKLQLGVWPDELTSPSLTVLQNMVSCTLLFSNILGK